MGPRVLHTTVTIRHCTDSVWLTDVTSRGAPLLCSKEQTAVLGAYAAGNREQAGVPDSLSQHSAPSLSAARKGTLLVASPAETPDGTPAVANTTVTAVKTPLAETAKLHPAQTHRSWEMIKAHCFNPLNL